MWSKVDPVVVAVQRISIPVCQHHGERCIRDEVVNIEDLMESLPALRVILLVDGFTELGEVGTIRLSRAGLPVQVLVNVAEKPAVIEIALAAAKIDAEEFLLESLLENVEPQVPIVQPYGCPGHPRGGHAGGAKQLTADVLVHARGVLHRIIEVNAAQTVESR